MRRMVSLRERMTQVVCVRKMANDDSGLATREDADRPEKLGKKN
jgi:hypothetical protein